MLSIPSYLQQLMWSIGRAVSLVRNAPWKGIFGAMYSKCTHSAAESKALRKEKAPKNPPGSWLRNLVKGRAGGGRMRAFVWEEGLVRGAMVEGGFGVQAVVWGQWGLKGEPAGAKVELQAGKACLMREGRDGGGLWTRSCLVPAAHMEETNPQNNCWKWLYML